MKVKIGTIVVSEIGQGPVVAITRDWLIHKDEKGIEMCVYLPDSPVWIPADTSTPDVPDNEMEFKGGFLKKVYISGPMTGYENNNYPAFFAAEEQLKQAGYDVINPARNTPPDPATATWESFMRMAIKQVCDADFVARLDGWEFSKGANIEIDLAHKICVPVFPIDTLVNGHNILKEMDI